MKRTAVLFMGLAALGGCMSAQSNRPWRGEGTSCCGGPPPTVPGVQGPMGHPVPMIGPYTNKPPSGADLARQMMAQSVPLGMVQPPGSPSGLVPVSGSAMPGAPSGVVTANGVNPHSINPPGMQGPRVISPVGVPPAPGGILPVRLPPPGAVAAAGAPPLVTPARAPTQRSEVRFVGPAGMKISWYGVGIDGRPGFGANQIEAPGRYNFSQGAIYRLKMTDLPGRPGVDLYPTLEVVPGNPRTEAFIAHSAVPIYFTDEDFDQVANGNYLVKVIYLPYPQYADFATTGPDEIVSTRLEPGADPIAEALKRGSIMLIIRLGNIDLEAPNTPPMDAPNPYMTPPVCPPFGPMLPPMPPQPGMMGCPPGGCASAPVMMGPVGTEMAAPGSAAPAAVPTKAAPPAPTKPAGPIGQKSGGSPIQPVSTRSPLMQDQGK